MITLYDIQPYTIFSGDERCFLLVHNDLFFKVNKDKAFMEKATSFVEKNTVGFHGT